MFSDGAQLRWGEKQGCAHAPARARENQCRVCVDAGVPVRGLVLLLLAATWRRVFPSLAVFVSEGAQAT